MRLYAWAYALLLPASAAAQGKPTLIGVLDQRQCLNDTSLSVRPLFAKTSHGWDSLYTAEGRLLVPTASIGWTVAFDGRNLGKVVTEAGTEDLSDPNTYARDRRLRLIRGHAAVPHIVNRNRSFGGWCDTPSLRPVVVVSRPFFADPAKWKPSVPDSAIRVALFERFKAIAGASEICASPDSQPQPYHYTAEDLILAASYRDVREHRLVALSFDPALNRCDGVDDGTWSPHWFLISPDTLYLGREMVLVDAGDYDNDRRSELLFWFSGYDLDGYILFDDSGARRASYLWGYH